MIDQYAQITLEEEVNGGILYDEGDEVSEIDTRWCLVGKFLMERSVDFQAMQYRTTSLWRLGKGIYVKESENNLYLFQFYQEVEVKRVIDGSPQMFDRFQLVFERLKNGENPRSIVSNRLDIWVQLHGMSFGFMSERVARDIRDYVGKFVESDKNNFTGVWREYLRIRVTLNIGILLKRKMRLMKKGGEECWVQFKYEGVHTFCFICGVIGHSEKFCDCLFEAHMEQIENPFGVCMRVVPRKKNHTIGSKWLRDGTMRAGVSDEREDHQNYDKSDESGKQVAVIWESNARGGQNVKDIITKGANLGIRYDTHMPDYRDNNPRIASNVMEKEIEYNDGMVVRDPKMRRNFFEDASESDNIKDVDMGREEGNGGKNVIEAFAAGQACLK